LKLLLFKVGKGFLKPSFFGTPRYVSNMQIGWKKMLQDLWNNKDFSFNS
jgi:hypothetical protein